MIHIVKIQRWLLALLFALTLLLTFSAPLAHADGGAPNLAYVAGTSKGISTLDISQQKVTSTISIGGDPHSVLLSLDGRFLYVTQPALGQVAMLAAKTGETICTAKIPGQPTLLAFDLGTNTLYAGGNADSHVSAIDPMNCKVTATIVTNGPVYGLAIATVGSGTSGGNGDQLWVANSTALTVIDSNTLQQLASIPIAGGPQYLSIPPGTTVYVTTRQGQVDGVDLGSPHRVLSLLTGGTFGPMDYDAITGKIYVPDQKNGQLDVLTPVDQGTTTPPHEPSRVYHFDASPQSIAITSDGQLGFVALHGGNVAMLDIPGEQVVSTIPVGGNPRFIITGLYPPLVGTTPQQASIWGTVINVLAYVFVVALFIVPILLFRRYSRANAHAKDNGKLKL